MAMYVDKAKGLKLQTLSCLNRTYPGKRPPMDDFVNEPKVILDPFKQYDEGAEIEEVQDLNVVYDSKPSWTKTPSTILMT